ncbi:MAG: hypothetical protein II901_00455 [Paludibacteraceae bacterium]|nr:hypothetical protein [Paludibacteraceae bacterium]
MAKAKVGSAGIEYISGAMTRPKKLNGHNHGNYLVMTHRVAETTNPNCQRIYSWDADRYARSSALSQTEKANRIRFKTVAAAVAARRQDLSRMTTDQENFLAQREQPNGKKTMKSYLWKLEAETYDAAHPNG